MVAFVCHQIDYICRRIASNPQKQAKWKLWATELKYTGKGLIGGYGIRWNITYDCRQQAYDGRKDERLAGKSAKDHYFKLYKLTFKEWEEINNLNGTLKYSLELTKQMEGDGPKLAMVLYEYSRVLNFLEKKKVAAILTALKLMFYPMIVVTNKYIELAINCDPVVLATLLHPAWRMKLFHKQFESHVPRITNMILEIFQARDVYLKSLQPETPPVNPQSNANGEAANLPFDSDGDEFNFYPQDSQAIEVNTELERYNNRNFPWTRKDAFCEPVSLK
ncbi:hypothetical protein H4Q26_009776 [Puccinia striiformis f. sp. tritici PST-130]|nr:hypothetical protein H4Q26_009776 [Puccinia striiformis f. sp. tritici PST-130]